MCYGSLCWSWNNMSHFVRNCRPLAVSILVLSGCGRESQAPPAPVSVARSAPRPAPAPAIAASAYVANAASIDLFIIKSAELALQRSTNARVREFASMMIDAHKGTSAQLSLEGRRLDLLPSAILSSRHQAMLDQLQQAQDFDSLYRRQQFAVNREALSLHGQYAASGTSPTLRPVAAAILPVIERDSRLLQYL
jgi:putative membrane protein